MTSVRVARLRAARPSLVTALLLLLTVAAGVVALTLPGAGITPDKALGVLTGSHTGFARTVVVNWRAPRVVAAVVVGAALGIAGALFQVLTRNPLGSPDVIGFNTGAYTGVLVMMVLGHARFEATILGAVVGGLLTALAVMVLSIRARIDGLRLILVGIGISAMLSAVNRWLITQGDVNAALSAASWGAGSLNGLRWPLVLPAVIVLAVVMASVAGCYSGMNQLPLGDDIAVSLGVRVQRTKLLMLLIGVVLVAVTTAVAGPISFIALAAPHIAQRLSRGSSVVLIQSAIVGALLLLLSDIVGQRAFGTVQLPVGLVTVVIGGAYLLTLIARMAKNS